MCCRSGAPADLTERDDRYARSVPRTGARIRRYGGATPRVALTNSSGDSGMSPVPSGCRPAAEPRGASMYQILSSTPMPPVDGHVDVTYTDRAAGPRTSVRRSSRSWSATTTAARSSCSATSSRPRSRCRCPSPTPTRPTTGGSRCGAPPTWAATPTSRASSGSTTAACPTRATTSPGVPTVATGSSCSPTAEASPSGR